MGLFGPAGDVFKSAAVGQGVIGKLYSLGDYVDIHCAALIVIAQLGAEGHTVKQDLGGFAIAHRHCVVSVTVRTMVRQRQSMTVQLQRSRGHVLRNTMLGIQIAICILFVGGSIALTHFSELALKEMNVPENDDFYKECILVRPYVTKEDAPKILEYLRTEAKDIECFIPINMSFHRLKDIQEHPMAKEAWGHMWIRQYQVGDSALLNFWNRPIRWILSPEERTGCLLLSDSL